MRVVIAGGSGLIGSCLTRLLVEAGHDVTVLSRTAKPDRQEVNYVKWLGTDAREIAPCIAETDAIVNLAGANIGEKRWSPDRKDLIRSSRVQTGQTLAAGIQETQNPPAVFVQASAVGYYGNLYGPEVLSERLPPGNDFLASVCVDWEASTQGLRHHGIRHAIVRFGIVLSMQGGALPRMLPPFQFGLGGPVGTGKQPFPWIHAQDAARAILFVLECEEAVGAFNITAPAADNNAEFSQALATVLHRPLFAGVPAFVARIMFGEMADLLLYGQNASSGKLQAAGFEHQFPQVKSALADLLS